MSDTGLVPTKLIQSISAFLAERRESEYGGWAAITLEDMEQLDEIVHQLVEAKCEPDADGDRPVQIILVNRTIHEPMHFIPVPYDIKAETDDELEELVDDHYTNLDIAINRIQGARRLRRFLRDKTQRKAKTQARAQSGTEKDTTDVVADTVEDGLPVKVD